MIRDKFRASILLGASLVLIGFTQSASAQSYYVPGAPTPAGSYYAPRYASPIALPAQGAYFFDGCTPCMPDQFISCEPVVSCEPDASGWTAAPSSEPATSESSGCGPTVSSPNPYGRFPESQNMEPIQNGQATTPSRADLALSEDHPLLRPFQGTHGPVAATYASTNVVNPSEGVVDSQDPARDMSRPVDATVVSNPTEERSDVAWSGILPPWMREPPAFFSGSNGSEPEARSANEVLERYGGVSRFDEPVLQR